MMKYLQKLGKALLLPAACLPVCGILMGSSGAEGSSDIDSMAAEILAGLGGKDNITSLDYCITRLRVEVKDSALTDESKLLAAGANGVIRSGKTGIQVIIGMKSQSVSAALRKML
ncbi:MAG TPA: PTS transporter subunit EIIB [Candidatus Ventrimonas merdavium]|nr:PTS transporter subunit EIIB [Candidatus Ventrimonas merdavium]